MSHDISMDAVAATGAEAGPSIRSAAILPDTFDGTEYIVGTSTDAYTTTKLSGDATIWTQEGRPTLGNVVVTMVRARTSDSRIIAGTHGRGMHARTNGACVVE